VLERVLRQLQLHKGQWERISRDVDVPYSWLTKLAYGKIKNPGVERIEKLDSYFRAAA